MVNGGRLVVVQGFTWSVHLSRLTSWCILSTMPFKCQRNSMLEEWSLSR